MTYHAIRGDELAYEDRGGRSAADVTTAASLQRSRARMWRYPPGAHGRRHRNFEQEEVFVVLAGTLTLLVGEPAERVDLPPHSVVAVETETPLQLFNAGDEELVLFIYGAPPATDQSEMLEDLSL
jgi:mannose-6-phosphate isomerase-like protein (cupin superfamily)